MRRRDSRDRKTVSVISEKETETVSVSFLMHSNVNHQDKSVDNLFFPGYNQKHVPESFRWSLPFRVTGAGNCSII